MEVKNLAIDLLLQLKDIALNLNSEEYSRPLPILGNSSVGAHNRHSIEFIQMLILGIETGSVSYDNRKHDKKIELNSVYAVSIIEKICFQLHELSENKTLKLDVNYELSNIKTTIDTTLERELIYNIEHLVHHMAIIKIGIIENFKAIELQPGFGIAQSTIVYKESEN